MCLCNVTVNWPWPELPHMFGGAYSEKRLLDFEVSQFLDLLAGDWNVLFRLDSE